MIEDYVKKIDNRTDLSETLIEFNSDNFHDEIADKSRIYSLSNQQKEIIRIIAEIQQPNSALAKYEFYFKDNQLVYASALDFESNRIDTVLESECYYRENEVISQVDYRDNKIDAENLRQASEYYVLYVRQSSK